ncbi:hypothetical protein B6I21_00455 [candidate division KSB1 bacterium 4572_119]|nr:MAG: hypothetical protein B6I21_00455 [candidate division KSB1 bacterium 4572_119]
MKRVITSINFILFVSMSLLSQTNYQGKLGYAVSPAGHPYDYSLLGEFFQEAADMCDGGVVFANSAWRDNYETSGLIPNLQKLVSTFQQDSSDYMNWIDFFHNACDSIKAHSPNTKVGTVFNFEHLTGVGVLTGFNQAYWGALDAIDTAKIDILGLTVYPFFSYKTANEIPPDYLYSVFDRLADKPLVITETGWPADSFIGTWISSPQQQVDYVHKLFGLITGQNVEVVNWLFLNYLMDRTDQTDFEIFRSVALRDSLGNDRPALPFWLSHCRSTSVTHDSNDNNHSFVLFQNYPNPFNSNTTISFNLPQDEYIKLTLFNTRGKVVQIIARGIFTAGFHKVMIDSDDLASGLYLYKLEAGDIVEVRKIVVLE